MTFVLTAFEPFDGPRNVSEEALKLLKSRLPSLILETLYFEVLPCSTQALTQRIQSIIASQAPKAWLLLGQSQREAIVLEQQAVNRKHFRIPDLAGNQPQCACVLEAAPASYQCTFSNLGQHADALNQRGFACRLSDDAGTYLCNQAYFEVLHYAHQLSASQQVKMPALFVHLPAAAQPTELVATLQEIFLALIGEAWVEREHQ